MSLKMNFFLQKIKTQATKCMTNDDTSTTEHRAAGANPATDELRRGTEEGVLQVKSS